MLRLIEDVGDTRIFNLDLTGRTRVFPPVCDKCQINPPCPGGVNHVGRVCYDLPSPFLSGCRPGAGWAKCRERLEAVLT